MTLDRESGLIRAAVSLDRELVPELNIYLTATDRGQPSRSSTTRLHLKVKDVDDNGPEFDAPRFRLRVAENQPAGTEVSSVRFIYGSVNYLFFTLSPLLLQLCNSVRSAF